MAEKEEKSPSIPWLPLVALIGVGSGALLFLPQLISSRPGGGEPRLEGNTFDEQTVYARLWQDPLGVAIADREKSEKANKAHSVARFQKLLIEKCFTQSAIYPLKKELRAAEAAKLQICAVMIPGGPYVEDVERRLRARRAVIEALGVAGYDPEKDDELGYFSVPWQPLGPDIATCIPTLEENRSGDEQPWFPVSLGIQPIRRNWKEPDGSYSLLIPYEWCEQASFSPGTNPAVRVLVLWLTDDAFRDAPLARLADLISWFRLQFPSPFGDGDCLPLPVISVLGPDNSGTLHQMVLEAKSDPWNDETRQCLATTHIFSSQAAAAESRLLFPAAGEPRTCKNLIEQNVKGRQPDNGFCFERTLLPDDRIVTKIWEELENRSVKKEDHVAIISEEDTYYARALCSTFRDSKASNLHSYTYLRGIDGKLPAEGKDQKETKVAAESGDKNTQSSLRPTERTEGRNQADDIRRLAQQLKELDTKLRRPGLDHAPTSLKAVGLLGSDVYDKLELLRALRPVLPEAVFFTNNLDARFAHPDEWNETHNLVVVSAFPLSLSEFENVPPFRDNGQTALFAATLEAMGKHAVTPQTPLIFEIGRNGPIKLSTPMDENVTLAGLTQPYLRPIGNFIVLAISLIAWTWLVSRVNSEPSKAKIENEELSKNENQDGGGRVQAT